MSWGEGTRWVGEEGGGALRAREEGGGRSARGDERRRDGGGGRGAGHEGRVVGVGLEVEGADGSGWADGGIDTACLTVPI